VGYESYSDPAWLTITKGKVGLGNVENVAISTYLSTWTGSGALVTGGNFTATRLKAQTNQAAVVASTDLETPSSAYACVAAEVSNASPGCSVALYLYPDSYAGGGAAPFDTPGRKAVVGSIHNAVDLTAWGELRLWAMGTKLITLHPGIGVGTDGAVTVHGRLAIADGNGVVIDDVGQAIDKSRNHGAALSLMTDMGIPAGGGDSLSVAWTEIPLAREGFLRGATYNSTHLTVQRSGWYRVMAGAKLKGGGTSGQVNYYVEVFADNPGQNPLTGTALFMGASTYASDPVAGAGLGVIQYNGVVRVAMERTVYLIAGAFLTLVAKGFYRTGDAVLNIAHDGAFFNTYLGLAEIATA